MGKRLMKHVIRNAEVMDQEFCGALCFMEHNCVSYNLKTTSKTGKHKCELNNATHIEEDLKENRNYEYHGAKVRASWNQFSKSYEVFLNLTLNYVTALLTVSCILLTRERYFELNLPFLGSTKNEGDCKKLLDEVFL